MLKFHWADYLVFGLFLSISASIGFTFGWLDRKKMTSRHFFNAGGHMHWIPVALSMQASFLSSIYILSTPTEFYYHGSSYFYLFFTYLLTLPFTAYFCLSIFYRLKIISVYEYLGLRYVWWVRTAGSATFLIMLLLYISVVLYTPATALAQVTGLSLEISILCSGAICTLYTLLGGMKATIWIDFLQMVVILAGLMAVIIKGFGDLGGIIKVWEINKKGGRIQFGTEEFNPNPTIQTTFWTQTLGGSYVLFSLYVSSQTIIQKFLSIRSLNDAYKSIGLDIMTNMCFMLMVSLVGVLSYATFATCDPLKSNLIAARDQLVPLLVMKVLGELHGLPGLFISVTFSAALSTLSGSLNALSAITLNDFISPGLKFFKGLELSDHIKTIIIRILVLLFGIYAICSGYWAQFLGPSGLRISISIFGFVGGPLTAIIVLGIFIPFVNKWGAISGLLSSLAFSSWIAIGAILYQKTKEPLPTSTEGCRFLSFFNQSDDLKLFQFTNQTIIKDDTFILYKISNFYYGLVSLIVTLLVALPVSLLTGPAKNISPCLTYYYGIKRINSKNNKNLDDEFEISIVTESTFL